MILLLQAAGKSTGWPKGVGFPAPDVVVVAIDHFGDIRARAAGYDFGLVARFDMDSHLKGIKRDVVARKLSVARSGLRKKALIVGSVLAMVKQRILDSSYSEAKRGFSVLFVLPSFSLMLLVWSALFLVCSVILLVSVVAVLWFYMCWKGLFTAWSRGTNTIAHL